MVTHTYTRLTPETKNIRLLTLLPGAFDDEIRITLDTALIINRYNPAYEALSYIWGSADDPVNIVVGRSGDATYSVTQNLATALRYLRDEGRERVLWIDAICVNQQDVEERGSQVERMADIYGNAHRVVIWLGPPGDDSTTGILAIHKMSAHIDVNWELRTLKPHAHTQLDARWADPAEIPNYKNKAWTPILKLLQRSWFYRLWIWQEVRLAKSADILCGYDYLPWTRLRDVMFCLHVKHKRVGRSPREVDMANYIARVYRICGDRPGYVTFLDLLELTEDCEYDDQRDKVYALQNLVGADESVVGMEPSYSDSVRDVFQNVVLRYLTQRRCLKLLSGCGRRGELSNPTWVPDWCSKEDCNPLPQSSYSSSLAEAEYLGGGILKATGLCSTYVQWAEATLPEPGLLPVDPISDTIRAIRSLWDRVSPNSPYTGGCKWDEAFCRTLCAGSCAEGYVPRNWQLPTLKRSKEFLTHILGSDSVSTQHYTPYLAQVFECLWGRSYIKTNGGHLGVGPKAAKAGDKVCKILGCHSLLLLRSDGPQYHTVKGECYFHGLMNDVPILGPFPGHWEYGHLSRDSGYYDTFLNYPLRSCTIEDPRLGPLPPGWRRARHRKMESYIRYVNDATREGYEYNFDPRMTAEALRERGVPLQRFLLK